MFLRRSFSLSLPKSNTYPFNTYLFNNARTKYCSNTFDVHNSFNTPCGREKYYKRKVEEMEENILYFETKYDEGLSYKDTSTEHYLCLKNHYKEIKMFYEKRRRDEEIKCSLYKKYFG